MKSSILSLISTIKFISDHPLNRGRRFKSVRNFLFWQISSRLVPYPIIYSYTQKTNLIISKGRTGVTGNYYCGLHDFAEMAFLLHVLREEDLFVDIGANLGSYSILASGEAGAFTVAFEPVPLTYDGLKKNILLNNLDGKVKALNIALGRGSQIVKFTKNHDTVNHVAFDSEVETIDVQVEKFDEIIKISQPCYVKIDVEGFETDVLEGMADSIIDQLLKVIIIELNGSGNKYGYADSDIHKKLVNYGFEPYEYSPFDRRLVKLPSYGNKNTIYIRDFDFVTNRLQTAGKVKIFNKEF